MLDWIPNSIGNEATKLKKVVLKNNCLDQIPWNLECSKSLESLDLSSNRIGNLGVWTNTTLRYLDLSDNQVDSIDPTLIVRGGLKVLHIRGNRMMSPTSRWCIQNAIEKHADSGMFPEIDADVETWPRVPDDHLKHFSIFQTD